MENQVNQKIVCRVQSELGVHSIEGELMPDGSVWVDGCKWLDHYRAKHRFVTVLAYRIEPLGGCDAGVTT